MRYYFNTQEQILGDTEYNSQNYKQALVHYKKGYNILCGYAASRSFKKRPYYKDGLAYVLCDIIITISDVILSSINEDSFDYEEAKTLCAESNGFLKELAAVYTEIQRYKERETTAAKYRSVFTALYRACEAISDQLVDSLDDENVIINESVVLKSATYWLSLSMEYRRKSGATVELSMHLGYLNLLERRYKSNPNDEILRRINTYIQQNTLEGLAISTMEKLEILNYRILVAVKNKSANIQGLLNQYKQLVGESDDVEHDSLIIHDINELIANLPMLEQEKREKKPRLKRRRVILDDSDEEEVREVEEVALLANTEVEATEEINTNSKRQFIQNDPDEENSTTIGEIHTEQAPVQLEDSLTGVGVTTSSTVTLGTGFGARIIPAPMAFSLATSTITMFVAPQARDGFDLSADKSKVFIESFKKLATKYKDHLFLANVLSLIGDFYIDSNKHPFKKLPLVAYELYENVLLLNNKHSVAYARMKMIYNRDAGSKRMINDHNHYTKVSDASIQRKIKSSSEIFCTAIEDMVIQIETFLATDTQQVGVVLDDIMNYVVTKIKEENIARGSSGMIANELSSNYTRVSQSQTLSCFKM